jgi:RNA polymerase sigma factor (sigma-70 family)
LAHDLNFEKIVLDHQAMVFRTLMRLTGSREHTEDLAQDVFLRLYRALPAFRGEASLSTYVYRIVVNVAQDEWKRRQKERPVLSMSSPVSAAAGDDSPTWEEQLAHPGLDAEQELSQKQFHELVDRELQQLSMIERSVLVLYHQEEQSYEQIAHTLQLPLNTVRTHLHRGRQKLREGIQTMQAAKAQTAVPQGAGKQTVGRSPAWQSTR